jgi:hypothetical protein
LNQKRTQVFVSYSHKDKKWLEKLRTMLQPLVRNEAIEVWDDSRIKPGAKFKEEIQQALTTAKVAVLLVTPDFLASEFIQERELPALFSAAEKEGLTIFWIACSASGYEGTPIEEYQAANDPKRPLDGLSRARLNEELVSIARKIKSAMVPIQPVGGPKPVPLRPAIQQPGEKELRILKELAIGPRMLRTRTSVAKETGIEKPDVDRIMSELARKGMVGNRMVVAKTGENRRRWFITEEGREAIASPIPVPKSSP